MRHPAHPSTPTRSRRPLAHRLVAVLGSALLGVTALGLPAGAAPVPDGEEADDDAPPVVVPGSAATDTGAAPDQGGTIGSVGSSPTFHLSNSPTGASPRQVIFGRTGDEVFIADTDGNGTDEMIVRRGAEFHVSGSGGSAVTTHRFVYGRAGDEVFFGDWDGDGVDTPAVRRGNTFLVRNENSAGFATSSFDYGRVGDEVHVGDYDADGLDTIAIRRGIQIHVRNTLTSGPASVQWPYGRATDSVLVGDTDGDGTDTFHVRRGSTVYVSDSHGETTADRTFTFAAAYDVAILGDWDGNGTDTIGARAADRSSWGRCAPLSLGQSRYDTGLTDRVSMAVAENWSTSWATFTVCERVPGSEAYRERWSTSARIGANGTARPGQPAAWHTYRTPTGAYSVTESFGLYDPGTALDHRILTPYSRWGGTPGRNYNQYYDASSPSMANTMPDENMWRLAHTRGGDYRQGAVINYNRPPDSPIREGMGYAIFLHANPVATAGCIAIPEHLVSRYLRETQPGDTMLLGVRDHLFG
ncbi:hypothetical protein ACPYO6_05950 [Georgenia sp. Z1344]|uniref:hypothetical protein n=1 Tax=Georgenia sp. Z1344 TaxID=3416706 RepID=UPI003CF2CA92